MPDLLERLKDQLRIDEGFVDHAYQCPAGFWTGGYGRNLESHGFTPKAIEALKPAGSISPELAELWLDDDARHAIADARIWYAAFDQLSENRQLCLANLSYNLGLRKLMQFRLMFRALKSGDFNEAANQMKDSRWYHQVGDRAVRLVKMMSEG